jgi:four helix bundle protein
MPETNSFRERCTNFSAEVIKLVAASRRTNAGRHIADQSLRSATSIGANVHEARGAESRADFIHKMQIALKEARETYYWLSLIEKGSLVGGESVSVLVKECDELAAILARSAMTARKNGQKP